LWKWVLRLALGALVVWLLARGAQSAPLDGLRRIPPLLLAACVVAYWCGQWLSVRRWQILLNALAPTNAADDRVPWRECASWYAAGMFWNLWMPTGLGGDAARALLAGRRVRDGGRGIVSVALDRALGLACLFTFALAALALDSSFSSAPLSSGIHGARRVLLVSAAFGLVAAALAWAVLRVFARPAASRDGEPRGWKGKLWRTLQPLLENRRAWARAGVLAPATALSLGLQAIQVGINLALARAVGLDVSLASVAWIAPVLALSAVVPLGIGGLGAREIGAVALLGSTFARGDILAWSLAWQAVVWLSSLGGAPAAWKWKDFNASQPPPGSSGGAAD
jgi:uncharacterized membrane protein YbhN (UPF0104 family)